MSAPNLGDAGPGAATPADDIGHDRSSANGRLSISESDQYIGEGLEKTGVDSIDKPSSKSALVVGTNSENLSRACDSASPHDGAAKPNIVSQYLNKIKAVFKKKEKPKKEPMVPIKQLFRFAETQDIILIAIGTVSAIATGASFPLMTIIFSDLTGIFLEYNTLLIQGDIDGATRSLDSDSRRYCVYFLALGLGTWVVATLQKLTWAVSSERQGRRMREEFYTAILRQNIGWFDGTPSGELTSRISGDINIIQEGISEKFAFIIQYVTAFLAGFVIAFVKGWRLALVMTSAMPVLAVCASVMEKLIAESTSGGQDSYAEAGTVASEVLSAIKTVMAFGGERRELERYTKKIAKARSSGLRKAIVTGCCMGFIMFTIYSVYSLGFWYGGRLARNGTMDPAEVLNVFFCIMIGGFTLGSAAPSIAAVSSACGAAVKVYRIIDRPSPINAVDDKEGLSADSIKGRVELAAVDFRYPTRPDVQVLDDFSIAVEPGQKVALVGESGCGKSTAIGLIERLYDPEKGTVKIDGVDVREYNPRSLRQQIGVIMQMPVLFGYSIRQNIVWGAVDSDAAPPTMDEIIQACKDANAHGFISELPDGYDTLVGERGALLSGGQKQRIAIARALIRNPKILLLDEATSALDTTAERVVQEALDRASANRTTITVAHRLSTIKDSDMIYVVSRGSVLESGSHEELIGLCGAYSRLVEAQQLRQAIERDSDDSSTDESKSGARPGHDKRNAAGEVISGDNDRGGEDSEFGAEKQGMSVNDMLRKFSIQRKDTALTSHTAETRGASGEVAEASPANKGWRKALSFSQGGFGAMLELIRMNKRYGTLAIPAFFLAIVDGASMPLFSIVFSRMLVAMSNQDKDEQKRKVALYSGLFFMFACVVFFALGGRILFFGRIGERITYSIRHDMFNALMRQDAAFFDDEKNGTGILTARLSTEATEVNKCIGEALPAYVSGIASIVAGVIIAMIYDWRLTLVILAAIPVLVSAFYLEGKTVFESMKMMKATHEKSSQTASETVSNIRTVATLTREHTFIKRFKESNLAAYKKAIRNHYISSVEYGFSQSAMFLVYCLAFYAGSRFILKDWISVQDMFNVMYAIIFSAMALGLMAQQTSVLNKALISSGKILATIWSVPKIDAHSGSGAKISLADIRGDITARQVRFSYPIRPRATILRGISLGVTPGKTIALVGPSGSGKSTVIALVQRLYDVLSGSVKVEDIDVREWNVRSLRENLSLVSQEPVLFDYTISENIEYGRPGATQFEIESAAKQANIHGFVANLPDGYNTRIGQMGGQLSGGQKQRIAIARALVRNPKILLLDEASSALDSQSEKLVQEALDKAARDRTTVVIAHRLSTIQNADRIVVFRQGRIIEHGTHDELIGRRGLYSLLVAQQSLEITH